MTQRVSTGQKFVLEVSAASEVHKILAWFVDNPKGGKISEIAKATGLSEHGVSAAMRRFGWFVNVSGKKRSDLARYAYRELEAQQVIIAEMSSQTVDPSAKKKIDGKLVQSLPVPQGVRQSQATDIVWAKSPPIPDIKAKYSFFEPPEFFNRLRQKAITHRKNISMEGPPGIGKSVAIEVMAAQEGMPLVNIGADAGLRARTLVGGMTDNGRFEVAQFATAVVRGWWAKIDEINSADPDALLFLNAVSAPPYQVVVHGATYDVHPEFRLFVTYNAGLAGTKPLPESLKDRFYPFRVKFPAEAQLKKMLEANGVDTKTPDAQKMIVFALAVAASRQHRDHKFDVTMRRLLDAVSDMEDGYKLYDSLYNTCVMRIDSDVDAVAVLKILDSVVKDGGVA